MQIYWVCSSAESMARDTHLGRFQITSVGTVDSDGIVRGEKRMQRIHVRSWRMPQHDRASQPRIFLFSVIEEIANPSRERCFHFFHFCHPPILSHYSKKKNVHFLFLCVSEVIFCYTAAISKLLPFHISIPFFL